MSGGTRRPWGMYIGNTLFAPLLCGQNGKKSWFLGLTIVAYIKNVWVPRFAETSGIAYVECPPSVTCASFLAIASKCTPILRYTDLDVLRGMRPCDSLWTLVLIVYL